MQLSSPNFHSYRCMRRYQIIGETGGNKTEQIVVAHNSSQTHIEFTLGTAGVGDPGDIYDINIEPYYNNEFLVHSAYTFQMSTKNCTGELVMIIMLKCLRIIQN